MALKKRGNVWYFTKKVAGRLHRISTGFSDKRSAQRRAVELEYQIRSGHLGWETPAPTVAEWWKVYAETYTSQKSARSRDAHIVAHFLPLFGHRRLDQITKSDCVRYLNIRRSQVTASPGHRKRRRISEGTVQRERGLLQAIFQRAIEDGYDFKNPWRGIKRAPDKVRDRVLSVAEQPKFLGALSPRFERLALFLLGTGARLEEARGIKPDRDINWVDQTVHVRGKFGKERDIPLPSEIVAVLREQLEEDSGLWTQTQQRIREVFAQAAVRAGIPHISPHALRHTFGTRWLRAGGDIYILSRVMGHASVAVTERHYAHLLKGDIADASRKVDLGLKRGTKPEVLPLQRRPA